ncbi:MAG: hypothetical protein K0S07_106 [Chlamydiales bacterium]|jgi:cytoskeletal protein RodZ|nr:hypothetical protein [Chlamydiales bacterium]
MPAQEELKTLGEVFRQRRQEMNLSLKEVENATSIRMNYLQAIEEGRMEELISSVYAQGFVKQYAFFLGIDGDAIIQRHPDIFGKKMKQDFAYGIGTLEARGNPGSGVKWFPNLFWALLMVLIFAAAWYVAKHFGLV